MTSAFETTENCNDGRFELRHDGELLSFATYTQQDDRVIVPHVETLVEHRGRGNAERLMKGLLDVLRATNRTISPLCPFAAAHMRQHPEDHDLLAA